MSDESVDEVIPASNAVATPESEVSPATPPARPALGAVAVDAFTVAVWFAVAGVIGAVTWWQVTTLPAVAKAAEGATLAPEQLVKQVGIDGWFFVIALVGGVASGLALLAWRRRDPLLMVVLVVLGGALASWVMTRVGLALGPEPELAALKALPEGAEVSVQLKLHATGMAWIWSIGAAFGAVIYAWVLSKPEDPGA